MCHFNIALRYSRLSRAMLETEIPAGQAASHSEVFVQAPNDSWSMAATILVTRPVRSACPWGKIARCETLAETKSMADAFLQAATHAPQPMQAAASMARSCDALGMGIVFPSGAWPVFTETKPPEAITRSKADRSTIKSRSTGNARALQGSMTITLSSWNRRTWSWHVVVSGAWALEESITVLEARAALLGAKRACRSTGFFGHRRLGIVDNMGVALAL